MKYALFWSGGKDSLLALDRAGRAGLEIDYLVNLYDPSSGRVRFHGVRKELIKAQADALGVDVLQNPASPDSFEKVFLATLEQLKQIGVGGIVFGNIHLADVREWYEARTTAAGFEHREPLWGEPPANLIREFVARGHRSRIVSVNLASGRPEWLGREFTSEFIAELEQLENVDVCGERGEYHSFAFGGPCFQRTLDLRHGGEFESEGHRISEQVLA